MLNTLVNDWFVHKGSQWALLMPTVVYTGMHKGPIRTASVFVS